MSIDIDFEPTGEHYYADYLRVRHMQPGLPMFDPPEGCPKAVAEKVREAGEVFLTDPAAAANRLRAAVEALLTARRIPKLDPKKKPIFAHQRIDLLRQTDPATAHLLEAVKWIGNVGSHTADLDEDAVLDGAEILAHALNRLYDDRDAAMRRLAKQVNKRRGPVKKAPKR